MKVFTCDRCNTVSSPGPGATRPYSWGIMEQDDHTDLDLCPKCYANILEVVKGPTTPTTIDDELPSTDVDRMAEEALRVPQTQPSANALDAAAFTKPGQEPV